MRGLYGGTKDAAGPPGRDPESPNFNLLVDWEYPGTCKNGFAQVGPGPGVQTGQNI